MACCERVQRIERLKERGSREAQGIRFASLESEASRAVSLCSLLSSLSLSLSLWYFSLSLSLVAPLQALPLLLIICHPGVWRGARRRLAARLGRVERIQATSERNADL